MSTFSNRQDNLYRDLQLALAATSAQRLKDWGRNSAARLPRLAERRVQNLGGLLAGIAKFTGREVSNAVRAANEGKFGKYLEARSAAAIDSTIDVTKRLTQATTMVGRSLLNDPKKNAPRILALALGYLGGSGGLDGNGGVPDTDIPLLGIGAHRSVFTHSIIAGTLVEGAILAIADLADVVCEQLPASNRDPFWGRLIEAKNDIALQLAKGASTGIAYHLAIDATLQPGAYHGLPEELPMEAHQTLLAMNATAEGTDVSHKESTTGEKVVEGVKSAGSVVATGVAVGVGTVWGFGKGFVAGWKGEGK